jgi:hypothetical protein
LNGLAKAYMTVQEENFELRVSDARNKLKMLSRKKAKKLAPTETQQIGVTPHGSNHVELKCTMVQNGPISSKTESIPGKEGATEVQVKSTDKGVGQMPVEDLKPPMFGPSGDSRSGVDKSCSCPICGYKEPDNNSLSKDFELHVNQCIQRMAEELSTAPKRECPVCGTKFHFDNDEGFQNHVNMCLDKTLAEPSPQNTVPNVQAPPASNDFEATSSKTLSDSLLQKCTYCPICKESWASKNIKYRMTHAKACSNSFALSTSALLTLLRRVSEDTTADPSPTTPTASNHDDLTHLASIPSRANDNERKRKAPETYRTVVSAVFLDEDQDFKAKDVEVVTARVKTTSDKKSDKLDDDLQFALALSASLNAPNTTNKSKTKKKKCNLDQATVLPVLDAIRLGQRRLLTLILAEDTSSDVLNEVPMVKPCLWSMAGSGLDEEMKESNLTEFCKPVTSETNVCLS